MQKIESSESIQLYFKMLTTIRDLATKSCETIIEHGLTPSQYSMLVMLQENPMLTQQAIATELGVTKGNVSQMIKIMERDGLVIRKSDGAAYQVMVTQKAIDKIEILTPEYHQRIMEVMGILSTTDITKLQHVMSKFEQLLSK